MSYSRTKAWLLGVASAAFAFTGAAQAQDTQSEQEAPTQSEAIVVLGEIEYRNRVEGAPPVLEYGLEYFQRFEPRTVGDMLRRTPSAAFAGSDMGEANDLQLRGLGGGYTQVLIDGERVPGSGFDRTFFVDRIPAELVERVEIIRSSSANRSGDAVAGALNIVLRDAYSLEGGYIRAGALHYNDDETEGSVAGVWGGALGPGRVLLGGSFQGRHNPKDKFSERYTTPPGGAHWDGDPSFELQNTEVQSDVRDGEDYTLNGSFFLPVGEGELRLSGVWVRTEREEIENSFEYDGGVDLEVIVPGYAYIDQENTAFQLDFEHPFLGGEIKFDFGVARFEEDSIEGESETELDGGGLIDSFEGDDERLQFTDDEFSFSVAQEFRLGESMQIEFGVDYNNKQREGTLLVREFEFDGVPPVGDAPPYVGDPWTDPLADLDQEIPDGGNFALEERRIDPFVMVSGEFGAFEWETGVRYETTEVEVTDVEEAVTESNEYDILLPSAHLRWNLTEEDRINFSIARTVRRPSFRFIMPTLFEEEFEDNDFQGNAQLSPETAWGVDIGYEHRIGRAGVIGFNFFYRDVQDVIEIFNTGAFTEGYIDDPGDYDAPIYVYGVRNTGDGQVWGYEVDLSTPLTALGLDDTGVFLNYSWLDSEIEDEFGTRRFNNQAEYVFNVGFIHDMPHWDAAFGATYRQQGDAQSRIVTEEQLIQYGADLEIFVERRFGERFSLRLIGSNLLDASKDEVFDKFITEDFQRSRLYDEYELETESTGPVFQLVGRYAF
ncbi:TonB-dependent receptor plug domain-containing protein [Terricaulis sp.]|uniref:TonB-dependent receptor plug domain-containing protein n=1 Tax=Terricaulis sp. TaxID=2768686 RepID=UPI002AC7DB15|nr:TonB-dependent receptor [Terricaulis sp.]MDZ4691428.1 TonB-dependent receptor [Terricaulis sp.]